MADLLTHYVTARLAGVRIQDRATSALFVLGVFLPDLLGKPLGAFNWLPPLSSAPTHTPVGLVFACGAISLLFAAPIRARAFGALYLGSLLHLALDLLKDYLGRVCAETLAIPGRLAPFEITLGDLRGRFDPLAKAARSELDG